MLFMAGCQSENTKQADLGIWSPWDDINKMPILNLDWLATPSKYIRQLDNLVIVMNSSLGKSSSTCLPSDINNEAK